MEEVKEKEKLPEGWKRVRLGEFANIKNGKSPKIMDDGIYPIYGSNGLIGYTNNYFLNGSFLLIGRVGASGEVHLVSGKFWASDNCLIGECKDNITPLFIFYLLKYLDLKKFITQTAQPLITQSFIKNILTLIPPLPEQHKIAEILETVDNAIEKTDAIIEKYKCMKQGLMQDLLTRGIDENGNIRSEKTHNFKDSPLGRIPEEWELVRLEEAIKVFDKQRVPLDSNYRSTIKGDIPYCGATGIVDYINDYIFDSEYVLIAEDGGRFNQFEATAYIMKGKFWANNHVHIVVGHLGILDNYFLMYSINYQDITYYISGSTRDKLNQQLLKSILVPLPPLPEQKRIAKILSQIDEVIEKEQEYKEKLEGLKRGLMEDLLTGKVRVNHLIEEVENVSQTG